MSVNSFPDEIWLVDKGGQKVSGHYKEEGATEYVRADHYEGLLEWAHVMIIEGEVCPCGMPAPNKRQPLHEDPTENPA